MAKKRNLIFLTLIILFIGFSIVTWKGTNMSTTTLASIDAVRAELVNSKYYLNIRSGYMAPVTLHCSYGDSGETVTFYLFDGTSPLSLTGAVVSVHGTRKDGANFGPFTCTVSDNSVSFTLQSAMTAVEGAAIAELTITKGTSNIGTANFGIMVENAAFPNGVAYDTDPSVYQDILKYVQALPASIKLDYSTAIATETSERKAADSANANNITSVSNDVATQAARIDNLIAPTTVSGELVDIRTGYDGAVYTTAGTAVRTQVDDLHDEITGLTDELYDSAINLVDLKDYYNGYFYNSPTDRRASSEECCFKPIRIRGGVTYYYHWVRGYFCFIQYDGDSSYSRIADSDSGTIALSGSFTATKSGTVYITKGKGTNTWTSSNTPICLFTDSQWLYSYSSCLDFVRPKGIGSVATGISSDTTLYTSIVDSSNYTTSFPDLNNPPFGTYFVKFLFTNSATEYPDNFPWSGQPWNRGVVVLYNFSQWINNRDNTGSGSGSVQLLYSAIKNEMYVRQNNGTVWEKWIAIAQENSASIEDGNYLFNLITPDMVRPTKVGDNYYGNTHWAYNDTKKVYKHITDTSTYGQSTFPNTVAVDPITLPPGTYICTNIRPYFCYVDNTSEHRFAPTDSSVFKQANNSFEFTLTRTATVYITALKTYQGRHTEPYNSLTFPMLLRKEGGYVKTCAKSGGDYSNLVEAINDLNMSCDNTLYVDEGDWDLVDDFTAYFGTTCFDESDTSIVVPRDIMLQNRIHIIFSPRAYVHYEFTPTTQYYGNTFSPFHSGKYGFTIEGLKLSVSGARYCLHDERNASDDQYNNYYKHCEFYLDNRNNSFGYQQCIGGGLGRNGNIVIEDCIFETESGTHAVSWHNASAANSCSKIIIKDSYFKNNDTIRFSWYGQSTEVSTMMVTGCNLGGAIVEKAETSDGTSPNQNTEVIEWNNVYRN